MRQALVTHRVPKTGRSTGWGELNENWRKCGTGLTQSPIDISNRRIEVQPYLGKLLFSYWPAKATLKNRGHDIEVIIACFTIN
jgi:carbonic anhydrase